MKRISGVTLIHSYKMFDVRWWFRSIGDRKDLDTTSASSSTHIATSVFVRI